MTTATRSPGHARGPSNDELRDGFRRVRRLSWWTIAHQVVAIPVLVSVMGGSQSVKVELFENVLALVPPIGVLVTLSIENRGADRRRPFGYHRAGTVAYLAAAFALAAIGLLLVFESSSALLRGDRPSFGGVRLFGTVVWQGWLMMAVLALTGIAPAILGRLKTRAAKLVHDKPLFTDAEVNRAGWLANAAGVVGILLVGLGFWWGDSAAALLISLDILRDGATSVARSLSDVMDHHPVDIERDNDDPLFADAERAVGELPFVRRSRVLMREHGRYVFAEIFVEPGEGAPPATEMTRRVREAVMTLDWRLQHAAVEVTDDVDAAANVLTREEQDIEGGG